MSIWSKKFWQAAGERAVKTAAQSALLVIGADQFNAVAADWPEVGGFALGGLVLSLLMSVASDALGPGAGPSATGAEIVPPKPILGKALYRNEAPTKETPGGMRARTADPTDHDA